MAIDLTELLARASIRGSFDPLALVGDDPEKDNALAFLAQRSTERQLGDRWLWMLELDSRTEGLAGLPTKPRALAAFLKSNPPEDDDLIGRMFQRALKSRSRRAAMPDIKVAGGRQSSSLSVEEQVGLFQVVATLAEAKVSPHQWLSEKAAREIRRSATIQDRLQALAVLQPDKLRGRVRERQFLIDFVTRGIEAAREGAGGRIAVKPVAEGEFPVVIVAGVGGIGKSALLAAVAKDLIRPRRATVIGFDFDDPSLRQGQPIAMSLEFSRQLGLAEPSADAELSASRVELRHVAATLTDVGAYESARSVLLGVHGRWRSALEGTPVLKRPLVLALDTFEEVVGVSQERLRSIGEWVTDLVEQVGFTNLSIIISGRAADDIEEIPGSALKVAAVLPLGDLGAVAGRSKLKDIFRRQKIDQLDLIPSLVATFGSNPLVLEVLARFCLGKSREEIVALSAGDGVADHATNSQLRAEFAQRFLYSRILERLPDENLKPLARPGLVLRRVTPQLIREVLAVPCGFEDVDVPASERMLADLKRLAWLVQPGGAPDEALHRKELRRLMLGPLLEDPAAKGVIEKAIAWFTGRQDPSEQLEALYYRGLAGDHLAEVPDETLAQLQGVIGMDVDDLPLPLRARIKRSAGTRLSKDEVEALPHADQAHIYSSRAKVLVSEGLESAAIDVGNRAFPDLPAPELSMVGSEDEDAELWRFETSKTAAAQSRFNTRQFRALAANAQPLLRHLFRSIADEADTNVIGRQTDTALGHPAYLSALASLAVDRDQARDAIGEFLAQFPQRERLADAVRSAIQAPGDARSATALALLCCHVAGLDLREVPGFADVSGVPVTRRMPSSSQANWRYTVLLAQYGLLTSAEPTADVFPLMSDTLTEILLPLPDGGDSPNWNTVPPPYEPTLQVHLEDASLLARAVASGDWPREAGVHPQSLVVSMKRLAAQVPLQVSFPGPGRHIADHIGLGLAPELRGPLRHELGTLPPDGIRELVGELSARAAIWPDELMEQRFTRGAMGRLLPPLVEAIDDSGAWEQVAEFLADENGIPPLVRGMLSTWSYVKDAGPQSESPPPLQG